MQKNNKINDLFVQPLTLTRGLKKVLLRYLLLVVALFSVAQVLANDEFVGGAQCAQCHQQAYEDWQGSHHDWAMKPATADFVLGDFDNAEFTHFGETTRFFKDGDGYFIATLNAEGKPEIYPVAYTFGFYPLQQYLLSGPGGRLQAFTVAWDSRPKEQGGQRWFHLYPEEATPPGDVLHWTGTYFTWNNRCADCHSTNVQKNYSAASDSYNTSWAEINVACEACHGPAKKHLEWVQKKNSNSAAVEHHGFSVSLNPVAQWLASAGKPTLHSDQAEPEVVDGQLAVCGRCHSRRSVMGDEPPVGASFDQNHDLQSLQPPLYHVDGQIHDEVYVLGSFMQSKMFQKGVVCSNCHNPHSLELKLPGNQVCGQCHQAAVFDTPNHHHHESGSDGTACVNCHMPETTYMQVDPRRDHSLRIPRPDLSERYGTPNACNQCHTGQTSGWASAAISRWRNASGKDAASHFSDLLAAAFSGESSAQSAFLTLALSETVPAIVQASSLVGLTQFPDQQSLAVAERQLQNPRAQVRAAAVRLFALLPLAQRIDYLAPLLNDPSRLVRDGVAFQLAGMNEQGLSDEQRTAWQKVQAEYEQSLTYNADSAAGQMNIGLYRLAQNNIAAAEAAYQRALAQNPYELGAYLNLADLYRQLNSEQKAWAVLSTGMSKLPQAAPLYHAAGLSKVRVKDYRSAQQLMAKAAQLEPHNTQYGYLHGLILQELGNTNAAIAEWQRVLATAPANQPVLLALLNVYQRQQNWTAALPVAKALQKQLPNNVQLRQLIEGLEQSAH